MLSDRQGPNFESCVWRAVPSHSSHHHQEVLLAQFSLHVHKRRIKPHSFHLQHDNFHSFEADISDPTTDFKLMNKIMFYFTSIIYCRKAVEMHLG